MVKYPFRKSRQFERYIGQVMRAFSGFQCQDGVMRSGDTEPRTRSIPVVYGSMSRIIASRLNNRDYLNNNQLPVLAVNFVGLEIDPEENRSPTHIDRISTHNRISKPTDPRVIERIKGPPFIMKIEVVLFASSTEELFDTVEQILLCFNPRVVIQTDTNAINSDYITSIDLTSINNEIAYPMGTESRVCTFSFTFDVPVRLRYPAGTNDKVIHEIIHQVVVNEHNTVTTEIFGDVDTGVVTTSEPIIGEK